MAYTLKKLGTELLEETPEMIWDGIYKTKANNQLLGTRTVNWLGETAEGISTGLAKVSKEDSLRGGLTRIGGKALKGIEWANRKTGLEGASEGFSKALGNVAQSAGVHPGIGMLVGSVLMPDVLDIATLGAGKAAKIRKLGKLGKIDEILDAKKGLRGIKETSAYKDWFNKGVRHAEDQIRKGNKKQPMKGFEHFETPDGRKIRLGTEVSSKTNKRVFRPIDTAKRKARDARRVATQKPDESTILKQFGGDKTLSNSYIKTNKKVISEIRKRVNKLNNANKNNPNWIDWQVEHVVDAQHFSRLSKEVPSFSGRGSDELPNLTLIRQTENAKTGAKAMKIDPGSAFIKAEQSGKLLDYNKAASEFMDFDMGGTVQRMTPNDWDLFFKLATENPTESFHDLLKQF